MDTTEAVKAIKDWAMDNYEAGGDVIVETFTDDEIVSEFIEDTRFAYLFDRQPEPATSVEDALGRAMRFCGVRKEYGDDIRAAGR